jgi:hypothetical protein
VAFLCGKALVAFGAAVAGIAFAILADSAGKK